MNDTQKIFPLALASLVLCGFILVGLDGCGGGGASGGGGGSVMLPTGPPTGPVIVPAAFTMPAGSQIEALYLPTGAAPTAPITASVQEAGGGSAVIGSRSSQNSSACWACVDYAAPTMPGTYHLTVDTANNSQYHLSVTVTVTAGHAPVATVISLQGISNGGACLDINNQNEVAGYVFNGSSSWSAIDWPTYNQPYQQIALGSLFANSEATTVNDNGDLAGEGTSPTDGHNQAFLMRNGGQPTLIPLLPGFTDADASYIDSAGNVTGVAYNGDAGTRNTPDHSSINRNLCHVFWYTNGQITDEGQGFPLDGDQHGDTILRTANGQYGVLHNGQLVKSPSQLQPFAGNGNGDIIGYWWPSGQGGSSNPSSVPPIVVKWKVDGTATFLGNPTTQIGGSNGVLISFLYGFSSQDSFLDNGFMLARGGWYSLQSTGQTLEGKRLNSQNVFINSNYRSVVVLQ